ncbi:matrixin family metalloprotease [Streptomyces olivaceoviridis]|uniref:matrixin family metalloprotease n=1 Tax=Streptomyces olivaceoviridis TaxID=1921 RepID=UPI0036776F8E
MAQATQVILPEIEKLPPVGIGEKAEGLEAVQDFLFRFGYLSDRHPTGTLDETTSSALRKYQDFRGIPVTGAFDELTRVFMGTPRCALPDLDKGARFQVNCAWNRRTITFAFDTETGDVAGQQEFDAVRNAFRTWAGAGVFFDFRQVEPSQNPDVRIGWRPANDPDFSMVGGVLAHADFPPGCGAINDTLPRPVHFNDPDHVWHIGAAAGRFDVETVALHEIGHILGLFHSVRGSVMQAEIGDNSTKRNLTTDDIDGIRTLYAWSGWHSLDGAATSGIATGVNADGRIEIFARGTDNACYHKWQTAPSNGWSGWDTLGGILSSNISTGVNADGRMEIFALGTDGSVGHQWQTAPNGRWSGWGSLDGFATSDVAVSRYADGRLAIFARGGDSAAAFKRQIAPNSTGTNWITWQPLGGTLISNISTGVNLDGRIEIFALGTDGGVYHQWQTAPNSDRWEGWQPLGGVAVGDVVAVSRYADGRLVIFALGTDNAIYRREQIAPNSTGTNWTGWQFMGGRASSNISTGVNRDGRVEIFARSTNSVVYHQWQWTTAPNSPWSGWHSMGGRALSDVAVSRNADGRMEIFALGGDNAVYHQWQV